MAEIPKSTDLPYVDMQGQPAPGKTDRYKPGFTSQSATFTPSKFGEGLSIAALFGSGPTPGGYMATPRTTPQREAETFRVGTGPDSNRLTPNASGYNNNTVNPTTGGFPFNYPPNAAVAAINGAAPVRINVNGGSDALSRSLLTKGINGHSRAMSGIAGMFASPSSDGIIGSPDLGGIDPWGDKLRGPAGKSTVQQPGYAYGTSPGAAKTPATKPVGLLETIPSMFTPTAAGPGSGAPGWSNPNITYSPSNMTSTAVDGSSQAFNPPSMQQSSRWNTGY